MAEKTIDIAQPVLSRNERIADRLRTRFSESGVFVVNVLSSPGSGKTTTSWPPVSDCALRVLPVPLSRVTLRPT